MIYPMRFQYVLLVEHFYFRTTVPLSINLRIKMKYWRLGPKPAAAVVKADHQNYWLSMQLW